MKVTDAYRQLIGLDGFNTLTVVGDEKAGALNLSARGQSADAQTATAATEQLRRMQSEGLALRKVIATAQPFVQPAIDALADLKIQNNGDVVTGSGTLPESLPTLCMLPLLGGLTLHQN